MNGSKTAVKLARIRIRMELPFSEFDEVRKKQFLDDFVMLTGCPADQVAGVTFRSGCVIFEGDLDSAAVERLVELYRSREAEEQSPELKELIGFLEKYSVSRLMDDLEIRVHVRTSKKSEPDRAVVVLVHGWSGDATTFGSMPEFIRLAIGCDVGVYPYPTSWWKHSPSILFVARNLDNWIRNNAPGSLLAFVAHSLGGLVVRRLLVMQSDLASSIERQVKSVTFVASPHNGATLASLASHVPALRSAQLDELSPNSAVLFELNAGWDRWIRRNVPAHCHVRSMFGTADAIVSANDARGLDPEAVPILGAGHMDIVKPSKAADEVVQTVNRFLGEAGFGATVAGSRPRRSDA